MMYFSFSNVFFLIFVDNCPKLHIRLQ